MNKKGVAPIIIIIGIALVALFIYFVSSNLQTSEKLKQCNLENQRLTNQLNDLLSKNSLMQNQIDNLQNELAILNNSAITNITPNPQSSFIVSYSIFGGDSISLNITKNQIIYLVSSDLALLIFIPLTFALKIQVKRSNKGILYYLFWVFDIAVGIWLIFSIINVIPLLIDVISRFVDIYL